MDKHTDEVETVLQWRHSGMGEAGACPAITLDAVRSLAVRSGFVFNNAPPKASLQRRADLHGSCHCNIVLQAFEQHPQTGMSSSSRRHKYTLANIDTLHGVTGLFSAYGVNSFSKFKQMFASRPLAAPLPLATRTTNICCHLPSTTHSRSPAVSDNDTGCGGCVTSSAGDA